MKGLGRNEPCWCESGMKYKKCHLDRDRQAKENPWDAVEANKKAFQQKKCWAKDVGLGACEGSIIKAHTVSRGPNLSKIAKNGNVIRYGANVADLIKTSGKITASEIGIRNASVFNGFCATHDRNLFSCIENEPFVGRPDQCLTVAYRTLSREIYGKDASSHLKETLRGADKGLNELAQIRLQSQLMEIDKGVEAAKRELRKTHDTLTQAMVQGHHDVLSSLVLEFDGTLPMMFAGAWSPFTDFFGNELQVPYVDSFLEQVFFSSFAGNGNSFICISWIDIVDAPGRTIADQISGLPQKKQGSACLQFVVKHVENVFFDPNWFEAQSTAQRKHLDSLAASGIDEMGSPPIAPINLNLDFNLPEGASSVFIGSPSSS
ncbi:MAG: SEC-C domain-containing protein [Tateyamaria sp.]|uniref:SEC-C domain-containing protein n=1 Tax=Tateyamaria sp. TaxID=1929288 RepID=UPI00329E37C2